MKKIVSLLAVALFATTFAAGCGKPTKCNDVTEEAKCTDAKTFEEKSDAAKSGCKWNKDAEKGKQCEPVPAYTPDAGEQAKCSALTGTDDKTCMAAYTAAVTADGTKTLAKAATEAGYECKFDTGTKCKLAK